MKQLKLIAFLICLLIMGLVVSANAQSKRTITYASIGETGLISVRFKEGNKERAFDPMSQSEFNEQFTDKFEGETYTDRAGNKYPVLVSVNKKKFVIRTSASGRVYRYYIK